MPDWLVERGIGETRAIRVQDGKIVEARVLLDGVVPAGGILEARLSRAGKPAAALVERDEYLIPAGAAGIAQGARLKIEVTREAIPGGETWKRPLARVTDAPPEPVQLHGTELRFPSPEDALEDAGWSDLLEEARSGAIAFPGGELRVFVTPAMTLIDVDGRRPPAELAIEAASAAARTILRHGIGGSIGIDFPTVAGRPQRQAIGDAFDAAMDGTFERTAVNGFGFLQVVRPRRHASLFELAGDRAAFEARALLRRAARNTGAIRLVVHPAVAAILEKRPEWIGSLAQQVGGAVTLRSAPALPIHGAYAEKA